MTRIVVQQLERLLNRSFGGDNTQSLLANLTEVRSDDWDWIPDGGSRSIRDIFEHAAVAKHIYVEYLFRDADRSWDDVLAECRARPRRATMPSCHGRGRGTRHSWTGWRRWLTRILWTSQRSGMARKIRSLK